MHSKLKASLLIQYLLIIVVVCGITGGMLYDLSYKMPIWFELVMWVVLVGFPMFTIYAYANIPRITMTDELLVSKSITGTVEIPIHQITTISPKVFRANVVYSIGFFYVVTSNLDVELLIPERIYKNEVEIITELKRKHALSN